MRSETRVGGVWHKSSACLGRTCFSKGGAVRSHRYKSAVLGRLGRGDCRNNTFPYRANCVGTSGRSDGDNCGAFRAFNARDANCRGLGKYKRVERSRSYVGNASTQRGKSCGFHTFGGVFLSAYFKEATSTGATNDNATSGSNTRTKTLCRNLKGSAVATAKNNSGRGRESRNAEDTVSTNQGPRAEFSRETKYLAYKTLDGCSSCANKTYFGLASGGVFTAKCFNNGACRILYHG